MKKIVFATLLLTSGTVAAIMAEGETAKHSAGLDKVHGLVVLNKSILGQPSIEVEYFGLEVSAGYTLTVSNNTCDKSSLSAGEQFSVKSNTVGVLNAAVQVDDRVRSVWLSNGNTDVCMDAA